MAEAAATEREASGSVSPPGQAPLSPPGQAPLSPRAHEFLRALASPARQRIMLLFSQGSELSVSEVADRAGIGQSTASEQLTLLRRGGILASRREGKTVFYHADRQGVLDVLDDLRSYLLTCC